jgi:hypothetical protein
MKPLREAADRILARPHGLLGQKLTVQTLSILSYLMNFLDAQSGRKVYYDLYPHFCKLYRKHEQSSLQECDMEILIKLAHSMVCHSSHTWSNVFYMFDSSLACTFGTGPCHSTNHYQCCKPLIAHISRSTGSKNLQRPDTAVNLISDPGDPPNMRLALSPHTLHNVEADSLQMYHKLCLFSDVTLERQLVVIGEGISFCLLLSTYQTLQPTSS